MLTVRAIIQNKIVTFIDKIDMSDENGHEILITFLDDTATRFEGLTERDLLKIVGKKRFSLSNKEIEILKLAQQGLTNGQIAEKFEITYGTARNYLTYIYEKLKVPNRTSAIAKANEYGLLD